MALRTGKLSAEGSSGQPRREGPPLVRIKERLTATSAPASAATANWSRQTWQPWRTLRLSERRQGSEPEASPTERVHDVQAREGGDGDNETNDKGSDCWKRTRSDTSPCQNRTNLGRSRPSVFAAVEALREHVLAETASNASSRFWCCTSTRLQSRAALLRAGHVLQGVSSTGPRRRKSAGDDRRRARNELVVLGVLCSHGQGLRVSTGAHRDMASCSMERRRHGTRRQHGGLIAQDASGQWQSTMCSTSGSRAREALAEGQRKRRAG